MLEPNQFIKPPFQPSVSLFDQKRVGRETKRWAWFAGDVIPARRKKEIGGWLQWGGEETNSPCIQKFFRGFIPRGLPALLETAPDWMPEELLRNSGGEVWNGAILNEEQIKNRLSFVPIFPGDGLNNILNRSNNDEDGKKGIVELTGLAGKSWEECHSDGSGLLDILEVSFYGDGIEPTLRGLKEQITHAVVPSLGIDVGQLKSEMLSGCEEFHDWGLSKINRENTQLRQGTKADWVYTYSPLAELLLVQLELQRQDQPFAELAKLTADLTRAVQPQQNGMSAIDLDMLDRRFEDRIEARLAQARKADADRIAELEARLEASEPAELNGEALAEALRSNERPASIHHKTWEKMRREAGLE